MKKYLNKINPLAQNTKGKIQETSKKITDFTEDQIKKMPKEELIKHGFDTVNRIKDLLGSVDEKIKKSKGKK